MFASLPCHPQFLYPLPNEEVTLGIEIIGHDFPVRSQHRRLSFPTTIELKSLRMSDRSYRRPINCLKWGYLRSRFECSANKKEQDEPRRMSPSRSLLIPSNGIFHGEHFISTGWRKKYQRYLSCTAKNVKSPSSPLQSPG
jgi:hypothetical protein